jgi:hypothetical protein
MMAYKRLNQERMVKVVLEENPTLRTRMYEDAGFKVEGDKSKRRATWLSAK